MSKDFNRSRKKRTSNASFMAHVHLQAAPVYVSMHVHMHQPWEMSQMTQHPPARC